MYLDFIEVKGIYSEIHRQCVMNLLHQPEVDSAKIFFKIINECEKLLDVYEACFLKEQYWGFDEDDYTDNSNPQEDFGIAREIKKVYHSAGMKNTQNKEDAFFLCVKRAKLLDWEEGKSPYRELRGVSLQYRNKVKGGGRDISYFFEQVLELLKKDLPLDVFVQKTEKLLMIAEGFWQKI